jgi:hypothetical protein
MMACKNAQGPGADCSYGPGPATLTANYWDEAWNATRVADALQRMGHAPTTEARLVHARDGDLWLRVHRLANGSAQVLLEFSPPTLDIGYTQAEANRIVDETQAAAEPRAFVTLDAFERETGWTRDAPPEWMRAVSVA